MCVSAMMILLWRITFVLGVTSASALVIVMEDKISAMQDIWFGQSHCLVIFMEHQLHAVHEMQSFKAG